MWRCLLQLSLLAAAGARMIVNESLATSTCSGSFNVPCAIATINGIVDSLAVDLLAASDSGVVTSILDAVTSGTAPYAEPVNFWATVYRASSKCAASGRPGLSSPVGKLAEDIAAEESGFPQPGLWSRIVDAAESGDGYFTFSGYDNFNQKARANRIASSPPPIPLQSPVDRSCA